MEVAVAVVMEVVVAVAVALPVALLIALALPMAFFFSRWRYTEQYQANEKLPFCFESNERYRTFLRSFALAAL